MNVKRLPTFQREAFTLLELLCVIAIIFILAVIVLQANTGWKERADQSRCLSNLKSLYIGASSYIQQQGHWPQIDPRLCVANQSEYARQWLEALAPYGIGQASWVCPTVQHNLGNPDMTKAENRRVDYISTPFDERPNTPYIWDSQPWFIEKAASHPGGNLLIFETGQTKTISEVTHR